MRNHARILSLAASEIVGEPDTIARRPDVIDALKALAGDPALHEAVERVAPGALAPDPSTAITTLAADLEPYREALLDDDPELVERLLFVSWLLHESAKEDQPTSDMPALSAV